MSQQHTAPATTSHRVVDTAQYFAWMRAFSRHVLIANPLTPDAGSRRFFNLQWWLLGVVANHTPLGAVATYQLLRIVASLRPRERP